MNLNEHAAKIEKAALDVSNGCVLRSVWGTDGVGSQTVAEGQAITGDLGGRATTKEYTAAIIGKLTGV